MGVDDQETVRRNVGLNGLSDEVVCFLDRVQHLALHLIFAML